MKLLLDTHILLWTLTNDPNLPPLARKLIADESNMIFFSSVSAWEVELKHAFPVVNQRQSAGGLRHKNRVFSHWC